MTDRASAEKSAGAFRTISEVAEELNVPQHVLRFWETRFNQIKPLKRGGGRRFYRPDDVDLIRGIRHLLYGKGYTIRGVQRILKEEGVRFVQAAWREGWSPPVGTVPPDSDLDDADEAPPPGDDDSFLDDGDTDDLPIDPDERSVDETEGGWSRDTQHDLGSLWSPDPAAVASVGPPAHPVHPVAVQAGPSPRPSPRLSPLGRDMLMEALAELAECRRLLAAVRGGTGPADDP